MSRFKGFGPQPGGSKGSRSQLAQINAAARLAAVMKQVTSKQAHELTKADAMAVRQAVASVDKAGLLSGIEEAVEHARELAETIDSILELRGVR